MWDCLVAQMGKSPPAMQETQVQSLGWENPLRKKWPPTPLFLPGESHGQRNLVDYSPWGHKNSDMTEETAHKHTWFGSLQVKLGRTWGEEMKYPPLLPEVIILLLLLFCHSVVSDSLQPHELQRARLPCPPLFPRVCPNLCPLSQ